MPQWWWIANARFFGALDVDEASSVATSLQFHRAIAVSPAQLERAFFDTGNGPLVPLLSVPFISAFGRSAITPMFVQPVLVMLSALGVAGSVNQLAGRRAAVVAGCCTLAMPALITSSRSDQFSNGVGAAMCLGMWALLASDRGRRTWLVVAFGAACGAMTISRTMSVSFIPAMAAAALVISALNERKVRWNLALGAASALVVALPWWWVQWDYVSAYLLSSGYGGRAGFFGEQSIGRRIGLHWYYLVAHFRAFMAVGTLFSILAGVEAARRVRRDPGGFVSRNRGLIAMWLAILLATLALLSSSNRGGWFSTPLDSLLVIAVVAAVTSLLRKDDAIRLPALLAAIAGVGLVTLWFERYAGTGKVGLGVMLSVALIVVYGRSRRSAAISFMVGAVVVGTLAASVPLVGPPGSVGTSLRDQFIDRLESFLATAYEADARLLSPDVDTRRRVAAEWGTAAQELDRRLIELEDEMSLAGSGLLAEVMVGSRSMFSSSTIAVARELGPRGVWWMEHPNTFETSDDEIRAWLTPRTTDGTPRLIVAIEGRTSPFPDSVGWHRLVRLAEQEGWVLDSAIPLPDRGRVAIYVHPSNLPDR